ncbi:MAG: signal peptidase II [Archangium sp.]|nr:signal peptidase II [Archangium sp.]
MQRKYISLLVVAAALVLLDQGAKFWVLDRLTTAFDGATSKMAVFFGTAPEPGYDGYHFRPKDQIVFSDDFFRLRYAENPGAAFGLFTGVNPQFRGPLFFLVTLGAIALVVHTARKLKGEKNERWARVGLPLVLGGALGNFVDRLARSFVIDFLEAHWFDKAYWPAFNVADTAIVVGVILLLIDSFVRPEPEAPVEKKA